MTRFCLFLLLSGLFFSPLAHAQDFTFNDLVRLRALSLTEFETEVMAKGYELADVTKDNDQVAIFKKEGHKIAYGLIGNPHAQGRDTVVTYTVYNNEEFNAIKKQKAEDPQHPDVVHFFNDSRFIVHVYVDGRICAHFRTKTGAGTSYEIKVIPDNTDRYNQYSTLNGNIRW
jgi:hypothetical protein